MKVNKTEAISRELAIIRRKGRGLIRPVAVVEYARDPSSAMHDQFNWDDTKAAHEFRLEQARRLIRAIVVIHPKDQRPIRAIVSLTSDRKRKGGGYRPIENVLESPSLTEVMLNDALSYLETFRVRYERLRTMAPQLTSVFDAIDSVLSLRHEQSKTSRRKTGT